MANIMSQVKLENRVSRNGFDLSRKNAFTAKVGELLPVACIECIPGDKVKGRVQHFTRTMPVNTAAYTRIREYYDWFFVPTNLLWNKFNTFVTQMTDNNQHATSITSSQVLTNQHPYFTCNQVAQYLLDLSTSTANEDPNLNIFNYSRSKQTAKLLNYLGYGDFSRYASGAQENITFRVNANLNPFPLLAYQKIYQDFFRNSQWEQAYAPAFNIDYISGAQNSLNLPISSLTSQTRSTENMFDLRYCNWNKDLFMGLMPNSQYGAAATIQLPSSSAFNFGANSITTSISNSSAQVAVVNPSDSNSVTTADGRSLTVYLSASRTQALRDSLGIDFSILALRQAEALQKWQEITQSQQQDYKNQIEAHFGVSPDDALSDRCFYIDGSVSNLDISEVTNTNITGSNAAEIAGKGVGVGDGSINFSTRVHGYLMCIYHAVPLLDYARDGINRVNMKTYVTDYAIPEFDKTGMVSVPTVELSNTFNSTFTAELLGYAPRYYDYKTAVDEVHGAFVDGGLGAWVAPVDKTYINSYLAATHGDGASINYLWFKVNPAVLNPIFAQNVNSDTSTDQLLVNASFELTAVRDLDRNGLPY